jgi:hypothetical protein
MRKSLRFAVLLATWFAAFLAVALLLAPRYAGAQPHGYAVVQAPADASVAPPPQAAGAPAPAGNWYYCESTHTYYPYFPYYPVPQCAEGSRTVPATPPQPQ